MNNNYNDKLIGLPYNIFNSLQLQNQSNKYGDLFVKPEIKHLANLDNELKNILDNQILPADIKYSKYIELMSKYNNLLTNIKATPLEFQIKQQKNVSEKLNEQNAQNVLMTPQPNINNNAPQTSPQENLTPRSGIISTLPQNQRDRGTQLLDIIEHHPNIEWNNVTNTVKINGKEIDGSNMTRILNDFMRPRKNTSAGVDEIGEILIEDEISQNLIVNKEKWNDLLWRRSRNNNPKKKLAHEFDLDDSYNNDTPFQSAKTSGRNQSNSKKNTNKMNKNGYKQGSWS